MMAAFRMSRLAAMAVAGVLITAPAPLAPAADEPRITLALHDTELSEVMEMLSRQQRINILLTGDVGGEVSFSLYDVHIEQAIRDIAAAAGYAVEHRNGSYFIVDHDDAGKYAPDGITVVRSFEIRYADPAALEDTLAPYLSSYGALTLAEERRLLIVEDTPEFVERMAALVAELDRQPTQILIEAKILEVTLDDEESFGIDWARLFESDGGEGRFGTRQLSQPDAAGFFFNYATPDVEATLTALSARGRVRTLSTPKLLALQNQEASVIIGDRRGYQVTTTINQVTSETIEFLESGVILRVTPNVDNSGRVMMDIHPEVSNGTVDVNGIPSQTTTEVTTRLIVPAGQTIFIGGLMKHTLSEVSNGVPVLSDIPGVRRLFSNSELTNVNTETVVLITPYIMDGRAAEVNRMQIDIVDNHDEVLRDQQRRMHDDVNTKFPRTKVDLSGYRSLRMSGPGKPRTAPAEQAYTIYLFHAHSEGDARRFVADHDAAPGLRYLPREGDGLYALVFGRYASADAAAAALGKLPPGLARWQPVVKRLDDLRG